ncbi:hypothetical protein WHR41_04044 [Cladosporium halotolerans]|uniref:Myb-like domain-containing protein n=1 Tax=Cladosporium halotolerans TaxID=1052096 RepID=A0AB34KUL7_9PEZI
MPFFIQPFFRKPFKLIALDADTNQPLDPHVRRRTRVTYYELQNGSNGSKKLVAHKGSSEAGAAKQEAEVKPEEGKPGENKTGGDNAEEKKADAPAAEKKPVADANAAWTPEEDAKLKALKGEGKTWRQIGEEMGRGKAALQARWKEIGGAGGNAGGNDQGKKNDGGAKGGSEQGKKDEGGMDGEGKKPEGKQEGQGKQGKKGKGGKGEGGKGEGGNQGVEAKKEQSVAKDESLKAADANQETRFTMGDWLVLQEDDLFSFGELQCLSELIAKDCDQSWQRISANFFNLTGRRIHPNDVREKFESMALMAEGRK